MIYLYIIIQVFSRSFSPVDGAKLSIVELGLLYYTNQYGAAEIRIKEKNKHTLRISHPFYNNKTVVLKKSDLNSIDTLKIYLDEKVFETDEVNVYGKSRQIDIAVADAYMQLEMKKNYEKLSFKTLLSDLSSIRVDENKKIKLRGFDQRYISIVVDNVPVSSEELANFNIDRLNISDFSELKLDKSPSSVLYGNNSLAGALILNTSSPASNGIVSSVSYDDFSKLYRFNSELSLVSSWLPSRLNFNYSNSKRLKSYNTNLKFYPDLYKDSDTKFKVKYYASNSNSDENFTYKKEGSFLSLYANHKHHFNTSSEISYISFYDRRKNDSRYSENQDVNEKEMRFYNHLAFETSFYEIRNKFEFIYEQINFSLKDISDISENLSNKSVLWTLNKSISQFDFNGGLRLDQFYNEENNLSSLLAASYKLSDQVILKLRFSEGYKIPSMSELYGFHMSESGLNYVILGSKRIKDFIAGKQYLPAIKIDQKDLFNLKAESSHAYQFSFNFFNEKMSSEFNVFHIKKKNHIRLSRIAYLTNSVATIPLKVNSYINSRDLIHQGFDFDINYKLNTKISLNLNYSYLDLYEPIVVDDLRDKKRRLKYIVTNGFDDIIINENDYMGLFDEAKHQATLSFRHVLIDSLLSYKVSSEYMGEYGYFDTNQNSIYDRYDKKLAAYFLFNFAVDLEINRNLNLSFYLNNIANTVRFEGSFPAIRNRNIIIQLNYSF